MKNIQRIDPKCRPGIHGGQEDIVNRALCFHRSH